MNPGDVQSGRKFISASDPGGLAKLDAPCVYVPDGMGLYIVALSANVGDIYIGDKAVQQFPLEPGDSVVLKVQDSHQVWIVGAVNDGVAYIVESDMAKPHV